MIIAKQLRGIDSALPPVNVTYDTVRKSWRLLKSYTTYDPRMETSLTGREGFVFDLASVPRILWVKTAPYELSILAPLFHDLLYRHGGKSGEFLTIKNGEYTRRDADKLFNLHMKQEGVSWWRRHPAYYAVRLFGGGSWRSE